MTTLAELVQLLADTVPAVTDCDQSTVYLWDRGRGQLVPRAWTEGMAPPDGSLGPIVPVTGSRARTPPDRSAVPDLSRRRASDARPRRPGTACPRDGRPRGP